MSAARKPSLGARAADRAARVHDALLELLTAYEYARSLQRPVWDFAVELEALREGGMTRTDLRYFLCLGYLEHGVERIRSASPQRCFARTGSLAFPKRACFVLTDSGAAYARKVSELADGEPAPPGATFPAEPRSPADTQPHWDATRRELRLGGLVVKRFKQPARDQELVLAAFEEEGWPPHIDDPLPPRSGQDPKRHLHNTITNLNRAQRHPILHFEGDGLGRGVCWKVAENHRV